MPDTERVVVKAGDVWQLNRGGPYTIVGQVAPDASGAFCHTSDGMNFQPDFMPIDWFQKARRIWPIDEGEVVAEGECIMLGGIGCEDEIRVGGVSVFDKLWGMDIDGKNIVVRVKETDNA